MWLQQSFSTIYLHQQLGPHEMTDLTLSVLIKYEVIFFSSKGWNSEGRKKIKKGLYVRTYYLFQ